MLGTDHLAALKRAACFALLCLGLSAAPAPAADFDIPLDDLAQRHGFTAGGMLNFQPFATDPAYKRLAMGDYGEFVFGNEMKMAQLQPQQGVFDFSKADAMVAFAEANGAAVHGHTLVWYAYPPRWLTDWPLNPQQDKPMTREEAEAILQTHIKTVVGHYKGRVRSWDVVNEAFLDDGSYRKFLFERVIGPDYVKLAFKWAHEADPAAKLYYNDYNIEAPSTKLTATLTKLKALRAEGIQVDGVGLQSHFHLSQGGGLQAAMQQIADAGFDVRVSELDVRLPVTQQALPRPLQFGVASDYHLARQADKYASVMSACAAVSRCKSVTTWGITDRYSWIPGYDPGNGAALAFDEYYQPKPAYFAMRAALGERRGSAAFYEAENVEHPNGFASAGGWTLVAPGRIGASLRFGAHPAVTVSARGDVVAGQAARLAVLVDGVTIGTIEPRGSAWETYTVPAPGVAAGVHRVELSFVNDYVGPEGDRNAQIDKVGAVSLIPAASAQTRPAGGALYDGMVEVPPTGVVGHPIDVAVGGTYTAQVTARATGSAPARLMMLVDGVPAGTAEVTPGAAQTLRFDTVVAAGRHRVVVRNWAPAGTSAPMAVGAFGLVPSESPR